MRPKVESTITSRANNLIVLVEFLLSLLQISVSNYFSCIIKSCVLLRARAQPESTIMHRNREGIN